MLCSCVEAVRTHGTDHMHLRFPRPPRSPQPGLLCTLPQLPVRSVGRAGRERLTHQMVISTHLQVGSPSRIGCCCLQAGLGTALPGLPVFSGSLCPGCYGVAGASGYIPA